jgi:hypothetical protein
MAFLLQPMVIAALGLLGALGALAWAFRLGRQVGRLRYRLTNIERQVGRSEQQGVGLSQELSQLKAELTQFRARQATRSVPALLAVDPSVLPPTILPTAPQTVPLPEPPRPAPAPEQLGIDTLITAINRGDKTAIREASPAELNVTRSSEDAIQMGRSLPTILEVVSGGGSYLHVHLAGVDWLVPTERTLEGFRTHQPAKGLFLFQPGAVASARVVQAARLEAEGEHWRVVDLGEIHYPG